jgi:hypothetical protein
LFPFTIARFGAQTLEKTMILGISYIHLSQSKDEIQFLLCELITKGPRIYPDKALRFQEVINLLSS